uniref:DUF1985 domain-containing protein n=1 Tax=Brassica oleracea var. oleracea TaxID=109376 RepID=A0A0D3AUE9_BRAOL
MAGFWEMLGVDVDVWPTTEQIIAAFGRCEEWSQDDRMRLGYLAIFTGFIETRKYSTATRASLARLVMDLEKFENYPWGRVAFKVLMESLKGKYLESNSYTVDRFIQVLQESHTKQTVSAVAGLQGWQRTHVFLRGHQQTAEIESGVKEERGSPRKKVRKEKSVKARAEASKVRPRGAFRGFYDCWWDDQRAG